MIDMRNGTNRELFAARDVGVLDRLSDRAKTISDDELRVIMSEIAAGWLAPDVGVHVLTDDRAPVEMLGMRALDGLVRVQIERYRRLPLEELIRSTERSGRVMLR